MKTPSFNIVIECSKTVSTRLIDCKRNKDVHIIFGISFRVSSCPLVDEWIKKLWYIYTMEYCSAIKKKEILPFVTAWMDLEIFMLSEINQSEKDKYYMVSLICGI